jgi:hypothetical protein
MILARVVDRERALEHDRINVRRVLSDDCQRTLSSAFGKPEALPQRARVKLMLVGGCRLDFHCGQPLEGKTAHLDRRNFGGRGLETDRR